MVLSFNHISSTVTVPVILLSCSECCYKMMTHRQYFSLWLSSTTEHQCLHWIFTLPLLFICMCQFKKKCTSCFLSIGIPFYMSFIYFLHFNLLLHTISCSPNRFWWQIQSDTKIEGKIKLYICWGIFNYYHFLTQNHEHKAGIIIPVL